MKLLLLSVTLSLLIVVKTVSCYTECHSKSSAAPDYTFNDYVIIDYSINNNTFKLDLHSSKGRTQVETIDQKILCKSGCCVKYFSDMITLSIKVICLDSECHLHDHSKIVPNAFFVTKIWFVSVVFFCAVINIFLLWVVIRWASERTTEL